SAGRSFEKLRDCAVDTLLISNIERENLYVLLSQSIGNLLLDAVGSTKSSEYGVPGIGESFRSQTAKPARCAGNQNRLSHCFRTSIKSVGERVATFAIAH